MSNNCQYCSDCFQTGPHKSNVGENGYSYIQIQDFNNNSNNEPIKLPVIYPKPPTLAQQRAINAKESAPLNLPDYFQDYQYYTKSNSLEKAYPFPNNECAKEKNNLWIEDEVKKKVYEFGLDKFIKNREKCNQFYNDGENWQANLSVRKLTEILNGNYVFKYYPHDYMRNVLKYYICNH